MTTATEALRQLDAEVARALGWTSAHSRQGGVVCSEPLYWLGPDSTYWREPPAYSSTWDAAGLVVEAMRERGMGLVLQAPGTGYWSEQGECVVLFEQWHAEFRAVPEDRILFGFGADADTAPLAICRAALVALEHP